MRLGGWSFECAGLREDFARARGQMEWTAEMDDRSLFAQFAELRTLAYYRWEIGKGRFHHRLLGKLLQLCFPPQVNLYLWTQQIGPGFVPFHAFSTVVAAKHVGCNVTVFQGVTIGHTGAGKAPMIGDHVTIYANACVIGEVTIGDFAVIGAGAVVVKDVPPGAVVVGNPARILRTNSQSVESLMEECRQSEDRE
jgi:serine O-acetyltransferase